MPKSIAIEEVRHGGQEGAKRRDGTAPCVIGGMDVAELRASSTAESDETADDDIEADLFICRQMQRFEAVEGGCHDGLWPVAN